MPTYIDLEPAVLKWQAKHNRRLTYEELAELAGISIAALYRIKSGDMITPDLRKINALCKVLECEPGDILIRKETGAANELTALEVERHEIMRDLEKKRNKKART